MRILWLGIGWAMLLFVLYLSLSTYVAPEIDMPDIDKVFHFIAYFSIMIWFVQAFTPSRRWMIGLGIIAFSIMIEFIQPYTGRDFDPYDMLANASAVITAWLISLKGGDIIYRRYLYKSC